MCIHVYVDTVSEKKNNLKECVKKKEGGDISGSEDETNSRINDAPPDLPMKGYRHGSTPNDNEIVRPNKQDKPYINL